MNRSTGFNKLGSDAIGKWVNGLIYHTLADKTDLPHVYKRPIRTNPHLMQSPRIHSSTPALQLLPPAINMASGLYCNLCGCALVDSGNSGSQNRYVHSWVKYFRASK